jgi:hypothetical protein
MTNKKEEWKPISKSLKGSVFKYEISNFGRSKIIDKAGNEKIRQVSGLKDSNRFNVRMGDKSISVYVPREVAISFLKKPSPKHTHIIHKDNNYLNDHVDNLQWATAEQHRAHVFKSPQSILSRQKKAYTASNQRRVLDEKSVTALKKEIWDPKRKLSYRQLAEKYGVSNMQIYRIKTGELWFRIKVENEPENERYKQNLKNIQFQEKHQVQQEKEKQKLRNAAEVRKKRIAVEKDKQEKEELKQKLKAKKEKQETKRQEKLEKQRAKKLRRQELKDKKKLKSKLKLKPKAKKAVVKKVAKAKNYTLVKMSGKRKR